MERSKILIIVLTLLCASAFILFASIKGTLNVYKNPTELLEQIKWKSRLTNIDKEIIEETFKGKIINAQLEAIKCVGVFKETGLLKIIIDDKKAYSDFVYESALRVLEASNQGIDYDRALLSKIIEKDLTKNLKVGYSHYYSISDLVLDILVIRKCKVLRESQIDEFDLPNQLLTVFQIRLVNYSSKKAEVTIKELFNRINNYDEKEQMKIHELVDILFTYGEEGVNRLVDMVFDESKIVTISNKGMPYLIKIMNKNFNLISNEKKQKVRNFLTIENKEQYFNSNSQLMFPMIYFEGMLYGLSKEEIQNQIESKKSPEEKKAEKERIEQKIKEIKSKQRKIVLPVERQNSGPVRPEERGEDLSPLSTSELIDLFQGVNFNEIYKGQQNWRNEKCIELRKSAQILGDRVLSGEMNLSSFEQKKINDIVIRYIKLSQVDGEFEEAFTQIEKLWHLAVPGLVQYIEEANLEELGFINQMLARIKNEEVIKTLILKYNQANNKKLRQRYLSILKSMKYHYKIHTKNRKGMTKEEISEVYNRLVLPIVEK